MKNLDIKLALVVIVSYILMSWVATNIDDFFLPGSQPGQSGTFDSPNQCDNCHGGYDDAVEPAFNWRGSMMAQAMRDPLFLASLTIANQDAIDAGDLCIRCHSPAGWLEGRSVPTDGSALTNADYEGVQCHFCHKLIDPNSTEPVDLAYLNTLDVVPPQSGNGMYVVDSDNNSKRGPYDDPEANHPTIFSPFHSDSELCATCHDVSNPAFTLAPDGTYQPNTLEMASPTFNTYELFPVERTFSEWKMSAYNSAEGIPSDVFGGNKQNVSSCQDCHMKDVSGYGCDKNFAPFRNDLPLHDMTGGNTFVPLLVKLQNPGDVDAAAIDAGIIRAEGMLMNAATLNLTVLSIQNGYDLAVNVINETGHKLPSGYPEGRRMWLNIRGFDINDNLIYESGAYNSSTAELETTGTKIYEAKLGMSASIVAAANSNGTTVYTEGESFHFVLNNMIVKDNRIPPRGFTNANFEAIQAAPVGYTYQDGDFFDTTNYELPSETHEINVKLLYQTVSKEYIEFLRDANTTDTKGQEIYDLWEANGKSTPVVMKEAEFFTDVLDLPNTEIDKNEILIYPNPARDIVTVNFNFKTASSVKLVIYSLTGAKIETAYDGDINQGNQIIKWNAGHLAAGTYIMKINLDNRSESRLIIIK